MRQPFTIHAVLAVILLCLLSPLSVFAATFAVSGDIGGDYESFTVNVTVKDLLSTEVPTGAASTWLANIAVYLGKADSNKPIQYGAEVSATDTVYNHDYYWESLAEPSPEDLADSKKNIKYSFKILPTSAGGKTLKALEETSDAGKKGIKIKIVYSRTGEDGKSTPVATLDPLLIEKISSRPAKAPVDMRATPGHKSVDITWSGSTEVTYTDGSSRTPSSVLVMLFKRDAGSISLKASEHVNDSTGEVKTGQECTFQPGEGQCIVCDSSRKIFLESDQGTDRHAGIVKFNTESNAGGKASLIGLEPDVSYIAVLQYLGGVARSDCVEVIPEENQSLTELNGEADALPGDPRCFIVSAAFGSPFAQHVEIFRWARDTLLLPFAPGRNAVDYYYEHSLPVAEFIATHPVAKAITQAVLIGPAYILYGLKFLFSEIWLACTLAFALLAVVLFKRRRRVNF